jgi:hypothetical protein
MALSTQKQIREQLGSYSKGEAILAHEFLPLGSRDAVDKSLFRLVSEGSLTRIGKGVYALPNNHSLLGEIPVSVEAIIEAYTKKSGAKVQLSGPDALNVLGLSTQVPKGTYFYTDGPGRQLTRGKQEIVLHKVNAKVLLCAETSGAPFLSALYFIGKDKVTPEVKAGLSSKLTSEAIVSLKPQLPFMIRWMRETLEDLIAEKYGDKTV